MELVQGLRQEQRLSAQQQQYLQQLHAPAAELEGLLHEQMAQNPVMESEPDGAFPALPSDPDQWLERLLSLPETERFIRPGMAAGDPEEEERRRHFLESQSETVSFPQFLLNQIQYMGLEEPLKKACTAVADALDEDGFLKVHPADLAMSAQLPLQTVEQAILLVRQLDPPGVCAQNIQDRLLLQLERKGFEPDALEVRAVRECLDDLGANRLPQAAKKLKVSLDDLRSAVAQIQKLHPRLEYENAVTPDEYMTEEVIVSENEDGTFDVKVLNDRLPSVYISRTYRNMLNDPALQSDARAYITEKLKSACQWINGILQRQSTLKRVAVAIVEAQYDFFRYGDGALHPLTMTDVAEKCQLHETTVSRAVSGKFLRCKWGLYPLRHFFSGGIVRTHDPEEDISTDEQNVSTRIVKEALRRLVETEPFEKPLSDARLTKLLNEEGYQLARRTVAKYREQLGILPTHLRKRH